MEVFAPGSGEDLRILHAAWRKREEGQELDEFEAQAAAEFEALWRQALRVKDHKFLLGVINSFRHPGKRPTKLRKFVLKAWLKLRPDCTWDELKTAAETMAGRKYDEKTWRELRKSSPFCDFFPAKRGGKI